MLQFTDQCWDAVTGLIARRISNLGVLWPMECDCYDLFKKWQSSKVREAVEAAGQRYLEGPSIKRIVQCSEMFRSEYNILRYSLSPDYSGSVSMLETQILDEDRRLQFACTKLLARNGHFREDHEGRRWLRRPDNGDNKIPDFNDLEYLDLKRPLTGLWQTHNGTDISLISKYLDKSSANQRQPARVD